MLRALLTDDSISVGGGTNLDRDIYDVRLAAFLSLRSMGSPNVSEPQIDVTLWPVAFVTDHAMGIAIVATVLAMPPVSFGFYRRWRKRRGRFVERLLIGRAIFGGMALASMALGLVLGYYWLVSHGDGANFARIGEMGWARMANSVAGKLQFAILEGMPQAFTTAHWSSSAIDYEIQMMNSPEVKTKGGAFGFAYARTEPATSGPRATFVQAPYWAAVMASALLPAAWMVRQRGFARRRRRADAGQCLTCGYDLRQTPERCPECGAAALKAGSHFTTLT
jgi:hypothetical protein